MDDVVQKILSAKAAPIQDQMVVFAEIRKSRGNAFKPISLKQLLGDQSVTKLDYTDPEITMTPEISTVSEDSALLNNAIDSVLREL